MPDDLVDLKLPLNMKQGREWLAKADARKDLSADDKAFLLQVHLKMDIVGEILWQPKYSSWNRLMALAGG